MRLESGLHIAVPRLSLPLYTYSVSGQAMGALDRTDDQIAVDDEMSVGAWDAIWREGCGNLAERTRGLALSTGIVQPASYRGKSNHR